MCYTDVFFTRETREYMLNTKKVASYLCRRSQRSANFQLPVLHMWNNSIKGLLIWISATQLLDLPMCCNTFTFLQLSFVFLIVQFKWMFFKWLSPLSSPITKPQTSKHFLSPLLAICLCSYWAFRKQIHTFSDE